MRHEPEPKGLWEHREGRIAVGERDERPGEPSDIRQLVIFPAQQRGGFASELGNEPRVIAGGLAGAVGEDLVVDLPPQPVGGRGVLPDPPASEQSLETRQARWGHTPSACPFFARRFRLLRALAVGFSTTEGSRVSSIRWFRSYVTFLVN